MSDNNKGTRRTERQRELYDRKREYPEIPVRYEELKIKAKERMAPEAFATVAGGAGREDSVRSNRTAFRQWQIVPRILRDITDRDTSVELFGQTLSIPVLLAPIGVQSMIHDGAEAASVQAAASLEIPSVLSTTASTSIEDVASCVGETPHWFQLYWPNDDELTLSFLDRAERSDYGAIVVTVDAQMHGWRDRELGHNFLPPFETLANYFTDPVFRDALETPPEDDPDAAIEYFNDVYADHNLDWDRLSFLKEHTDLPVLLKGVMHPDDAAKAVEHGVDGIVVSNHGGRQVDGTLGALDALPGAVKAVDGEIPVLFDSGIRRGEDAFKALALGADAVFLGRPYLFGLAIAGEEGVREVLKNFRSQLALTLALTGHTSFNEVGRDDVAHRNQTLP